jgi:tetratricopeptide (TPR) repeat protein
MQAVMLAIACSIAAAAFGRGPDVGGIRAYEMPAYTLVSADAAAAQAATHAAAQADAILGKLLERASHGRNAPTFLVMVPQAIWSRYLAPGSGITGQFVPSPFANYIEVGFEGGGVGHSVMHEYAHCFLHTQFGGLVPLWFDEGIAQFVAAATFKGNTVTVGEMARTPRYLPHLGGWWPKVETNWMPMVTLLGLDGNSRIYRDTQRSYTIHKQGWIMVQRGLAADPGQFGQQMYALLDAQNELVAPEVAIRTIFGMSPGEFDVMIRTYAEGVMTTRDLAIAPVAAPALPPGRDLPAIESLELVASMMMASGYHADHLGEVVEAMQRAAPGSPVTRAWRMRLEARQKSGAALDQLAQGLKADSDPRVLRGAGLAYFERALASKDGARPDKALALLDLALTSAPGDAEAVWAYATLAAGLKRELPMARTRIEEMRASWPANADLAMAATQVYDALGDKEQALESLQATRTLAKRPELVRWAKQRETHREMSP